MRHHDLNHRQRVSPCASATLTVCVLRCALPVSPRPAGCRRNSAMIQLQHDPIRYPEYNGIFADLGYVRYRGNLPERNLAL